MVETEKHIVLTIQLDSETKEVRVDFNPEPLPLPLVLSIMQGLIENYKNNMPKTDSKDIN
jgi:hypothetical protein